LGKVIENLISLPQRVRFEKRARDQKLEVTFHFFHFLSIIESKGDISTNLPASSYKASYRIEQNSW